MALTPLHSASGLAEFHAIKKVGGIAALSRLEQQVLEVALTWKPGRDGWSHGKRSDLARQLRLSVRSISRALASMADRGVIGLGRWKYGVALLLPRASIRSVGGMILRGLLEAKRSREKLRSARPALWKVAQDLWQKSQCCQNGRTLYAPSSLKKEREVSASLPVSAHILPGLNSLDAVSAGIDFSRGGRRHG